MYIYATMVAKIIHKLATCKNMPLNRTFLLFNKYDCPTLDQNVMSPNLHIMNYENNSENHKYYLANA